MTPDSYQKQIDDLVEAAANNGWVVGEIIFPLKNMIATMLANAVVQNKLDAVEEFELLSEDLEELYEKYLKAYVDDHQQVN